MKKMTEEKKEQLRARMREYWEEVRSGKRVHRTRWDTYRDRGELVGVKEEPTSEAIPEPEPPPAPPKPETKISPIAKAEHIHFPMPGVSPKIAFMMDPQQPASKAPKTSVQKPQVSDHVGDFKLPVQQAKTEIGKIVRPGVNLVTGRKVQVKFQPQQPKTPTRVIMQFGRKPRSPGDL